MPTFVKLLPLIYSQNAHSNKLFFLEKHKSHAMRSFCVQFNRHNEVISMGIALG